MSNETRHKGLGRGLSALLGDEADEYASVDRSNNAKELPIEYLEPNPDQPRRTFKEEDLADLTASIREKGVLQPVLVRRLEGEIDRYQIVAGERRWRAAQKAALHNIPVIIKDLNDAETLEIALIENVQRADLNPVEEAAGYQSLIDEYDHTQEELAKFIGKSRSHITNTLRLLSLPERVQGLIGDGKLTAGHARTLIKAADPTALALEIVESGLSVRQAEMLAREGAPPKKTKRRAKPEKDPDTLALEDNVTNTLGLKVRVEHKGDRGGEVRIRYKTLEQLDDVCQRLTAQKAGF